GSLLCASAALQVAPYDVLSYQIVRSPGPRPRARLYRLVSLAVKAYSLPEIAPRLDPVLGPRTAVIAAQNSIPFWYFQGLESSWRDWHRLAGASGQPEQPGHGLALDEAAGRCVGHGALDLEPLQHKVACRPVGPHQHLRGPAEPHRVAHVEGQRARGLDVDVGRAGRHHHGLV